jgi:hypothetical protein
LAGAQDTQELVVASHGDLYVAPVGTALPSTATGTPNAAFYKVGLISEDGAALTVTPEVEEFSAWQRRQPVRRELVDQTQQIACALEQWNGETVKLAFGGGNVVETSPGEWRYDFPSGSDALDERSVVLDWQDGDRAFRAVFERASVMEAVETQLARSSLALLPITLSVLSPVAGGSPGSLYISDTAFHS